MVTKVAERKTEEKNGRATPQGCTHHWVIESCHGPTSWGMCRICGQKKEFLNAIPEPQPVAAKKESSPMDLPEIEKVKVGGKHARS